MEDIKNEEITEEQANAEASETAAVPAQETKAEIRARKKAEKQLKPKKKMKKWVKVLIIVLAVLTVIGGVIVYYVRKAAKAFLELGMMPNSYTEETVARRDIENSLASSGTVQPLDTYSVTSVSTVEGTVLKAYFEEGDLVQKDQVLYQVSTEKMESRIETAKKNVERAEKNLQKAQNKYDDALKDIAKLSIKSDFSGFIKEIKVELGDELKNNNLQIMNVSDTKNLQIKLPFLSSDADKIKVGDKAVLTMTDTGEDVAGKVVKVSGVEDILSGGRIVRSITLEIVNPGAIAVGDSASAAVGSICSCEDGSFEVKDSGTVMSEYSGTVVSIPVREGAWVNKGDIVCVITSETLDDQIENLQNQIDNAESSLENAKDTLQDLIDKKEDYTIKSPITGTVIKKNTKEGDTISSTSMNKTHCIIYDLSAMTFDLYVDELDVHSVKVGQKVIITADALEGINFEGTITNISLVSSTSGGVTQYPVSVRIDETGDLLPGMNVDGKIMIEAASDVIAIPSGALQRGNQVYVKDDSVKEAVGRVPAGFRAVDVKVGVSGNDYIEVLDGVNEGDVVYVTVKTNGFFDMYMNGYGGSDYYDDEPRDRGNRDRQGEGPGGF